MVDHVGKLRPPWLWGFEFCVREKPQSCFVRDLFVVKMRINHSWKEWMAFGRVYRVALVVEIRLINLTIATFTHCILVHVILLIYVRRQQEAFVRKWRCTFVGEPLNHIHQDTKSAWLIAVCKRSLYQRFVLIFIYCDY